MIENAYKNIEFLSYIGSPLSKNSIAVIYSANNISFDRCELFSDYVQSLLCVIFDTYLGDEITEEHDRLKHFEWCWQKNIDNFKLEGINFSREGESFDYFKEFMTEVFYNIESKNSKKIKGIITSLWETIFSYNGMKTSSDMDNFIEIYKILEKSIKKG